MILIRPAESQDFSQIKELTKIPGFLNLKGDDDELKSVLKRSRKSFSGEQEKKEATKYIFVAENLDTKKVLGVSMIAGKHGTLENPHFYFQVDYEDRHSNTVDKTFSHRTLKLEFESDGPSEIGALVVESESRNTPARVGRQLAFSRFLYAGLNRARFEEEILAELLPPLDSAGKSPLWEAVGRRFTDMDYWEADLLCQTNKEFIFSLFPLEKIYVTLLSSEAQNAIGGVGEQTRSAYHMLSKSGFKYREQVDPFDGGPHLWARIDEMPCISKVGQFRLNPKLAQSNAVAGQEVVEGLVVGLDHADKFRTCGVSAIIEGSELGIFGKKEDLEKSLEIGPNDEVIFMPYY